jgi:hypothetical protein
MPPPAPNRSFVLRSPDGRDVLRLGAIRRDSGYPSLEVRVEAAAKGFSGAADVWIDGFALKEFTAALRELEKVRQGGVELRAMSPEDFRLAIRAIDGSGHLLVEFAVARNVLVGERPAPLALRVAGGFELDPGTLREILAGFGQLVKAVAG